jgi:hypothetical protein
LPAAQSASDPTGRIQHAAVRAKRGVTARDQADGAAGISSTDGQNLAPHDRDPDGRRPWVLPAPAESITAEEASAPDAHAPSSGDTLGRGTRIDLRG